MPSARRLNSAGIDARPVKKWSSWFAEKNRAFKQTGKDGLLAHVLFVADLLNAKRL